MTHKNFFNLGSSVLKRCIHLGMTIVKVLVLSEPQELERQKSLYVRCHVTPLMHVGALWRTKTFLFFVCWS